MVGLRVRAKDGKYVKKSKAVREGTIMRDTRRGTHWWILWDGRSTEQQERKDLLEVLYNQADILNSILIHKLKQ